MRHPPGIVSSYCFYQAFSTLPFGSLQWLYNFHEPEGQLARWLKSLQELNFTIVHRKGKVHNNTDTLSRMPCRQCGRVQLLLENTVVANTAIGGETANTIQQLQSEDRILRSIIESKQNNSSPPQRLQGKEGQRLLQLWNQLHLKDGVLCCRLPGKLRSELCDKIVIPSCLHQETLQEIHEGAVGGHLGFEKTLEKVKERFYWPGQYKDAQE